MINPKYAKQYSINNNWVEFVDNEIEKHVYKIRETGELLTGVTTVLQVRSKPFLCPWAAKETVKHLGFYDERELREKFGAGAEAEIVRAKERLTEILTNLKNIDEKEYYETLISAKAAHRVKKEEAADIGTIAHETIEKIIIYRMCCGEYPELTADIQALAAINQFLDWEKEHKIEWIATETILGDKQHKIAGCMDWLAIVDGVVTLGDFKTSNQFSEDVFLQTAAYYFMLDRLLPSLAQRPRQRIALRIPKNGEKFEHLVIRTDIERDIKVFLNCVEEHHWNNYAKSILKKQKEIFKTAQKAGKPATPAKAKKVKSKCAKCEYHSQTENAKLIEMRASGDCEGCITYTLNGWDKLK